MSRRLYFALCCCRFLVALLSTGFLHPDEFFQSSEVVAGDVLEFKGTVRAWEFDPQSPNRSILPPFILTGIPFLFLRFLSLHHHPYFVLIAPRVFITALSFLMDFAVFSMLSSTKSTSSSSTSPPSSSAKSNKANTVWQMMCCFAASWVVLVFHTRSFSNTSESIVLSLALAVSTGTFPLPTFLQRCTCFACLCVLGFFIRFTFLIFAFPLALLMLFIECTALFHSLSSSSSSLLNQSLLIIRHVVPTILFAGFVGFLLFANIVAIDSLYFGHFTIAPINNLIYNLNPDNLALHGLHPFYLHAMVNMPLLFGPLSLLVFIDCASIISELFRAARRNQLTAALTKSKASITCVACVSCIVFSLLVLSRAPHQEARFLLPLFSPLVILFACRRAHMLGSRRYLALWVGFNIAMLLFFGFSHQAGIAPALAWAHDEAVAQQHAMPNNMKPVVVVFWETYTPPVHLAAISASLPLRVIDAHASPSLDSAINEALSISSRCFLITPRTVAQKLSLNSAFHTSFFPHFSSEAPLPSSLFEMCLDVFELQPPRLSQIVEEGQIRIQQKQSNRAESVRVLE